MKKQVKGKKQTMYNGQKVKNLRYLYNSVSKSFQYFFFLYSHRFTIPNYR